MGSGDLPADRWAMRKSAAGSGAGLDPEHARATNR
jgi:hypothetical protein